MLAKLAELACLAVLAGAGCQREPISAVQPPPPKVNVTHPIVREIAEEREHTGWFTAGQTVEVRARVRGEIKSVNFRDGDIVERDQLLFELDPEPFQASVNGARAQTRVYEAQRVAAEKDVARYTELVKSGGATRQQLDKAQADLGAFDAQIIASQEATKRSELDLQYSRLTAPIGGRISQAMLTAGNMVNAGGSDPLLTTIVSIDPIRLYFNVDERSLLRFAKRRGAEARTLTEALSKLADLQVTFRFALDGETEFTHEGSLVFGNNLIDTTTGTLQVYGLVKNERGEFLPGSRVRVRIQVGDPQQAALVPEVAILSDQDKRYVLIVDEKKNAQRRNVTLGALTDDGLRAILPADKLAEGDAADKWLVIVDNLQSVRPNYPVEPLPTGPAARAAAAAPSAPLY